MKHICEEKWEGKLGNRRPDADRYILYWSTVDVECEKAMRGADNNI
jgi:hypothetical protein